MSGRGKEDSWPGVFLSLLSLTCFSEQLVLCQLRAVPGVQAGVLDIIELLGCVKHCRVLLADK